MKNVKSLITIAIIQECVADATGVKVDDINVGNKVTGARKREKINARHISMTLTKKYTKYSLARIGLAHGGRDHASVLHACSSINNLIDTKDQLTIDNFKKAEDSIKKKIAIVKSFNKVFRKELPITAHGKRCSCCGNPINSFKFRLVINQ